ncbi:hypothetical protein BC834DRAFT_968540 [Gloeopeniophorella convolvens]|nr:hypothetical protein BC834DRAFT_968540 [Gloeopeniophorella convolvens]
MSFHITSSEPSDEDQFVEGRASDTISRRRSTRGPSHKRGPPKGYIHAIERRLQQVEALMGTITGSADPRAQSLLQDLSEDPLARQIINTVNHGPFGSHGHGAHPFGSTKEDFLAAIMRSTADSASDPLRNAHENDKVANWDLKIMIPNSAWQSNLQQLLTSSATSPDVNSEVSGRRSEDTTMSSPSSQSSPSTPVSCTDSPGFSDVSDRLALGMHERSNYALVHSLGCSDLNRDSTSTEGPRVIFRSARVHGTDAPRTVRPRAEQRQGAGHSRGTTGKSLSLLGHLRKGTESLQPSTTPLGKQPLSPPATIRQKRSAPEIGAPDREARRPHPPMIPFEVFYPSLAAEASQYCISPQDTSMGTLDTMSVEFPYTTETLTAFGDSNIVDTTWGHNEQALDFSSA